MREKKEKNVRCFESEIPLLTALAGFYKSGIKEYKNILILILKHVATPNNQGERLAEPCFTLLFRGDLSGSSQLAHGRLRAT